ncbi:MAG: hypothetical protein DRI57_21230, partial [Deltaproteobacteria bacterium]
MTVCGISVRYDRYAQARRADIFVECTETRQTEARRADIFVECTETRQTEARRADIFVESGIAASQRPVGPTY